MLATTEIAAGEYGKSTLANGVRVVTQSVPHCESVAMGVLVECGSAHESAVGNGLAHLCEHMLFQGTGRRTSSRIAEEVDLLGGQIGAFTARDYTCYSAHVMGGYAFHSLELLADLVLNSTFPEPELEYEKRAILREIDAAADNPSARLHQWLRQQVWDGHPLSRPIPGSSGNVARFTSEDALCFLHEHYTPGRIVVVAAGQVEHEQFASEVHDCFWRLLGGGATESAGSPGFRSCSLSVESPLRQSYSLVGLPAPAYASTDRYAMHALAAILGGGPSSRLARSLRGESGLAYDVHAEYQAYRDAGLLTVEVCTSPQSMDAAAGRVEAEIGAIAGGARPVEDDELWRAKLRLRGQHMVGGGGIGTLMSRLATQELYFGQWISTSAVSAGIDGLSLAGVRRVAAEWLGRWREAGRLAVGPSPNS